MFNCNFDHLKYILYNSCCRSLGIMPGFLMLIILCRMRLAPFITQDAKTKTHSRKVMSGGS